MLEIVTTVDVTGVPRSAPSPGRTVKYQSCPRVVAEAGTVSWLRNAGCSMLLRNQRSSLPLSVSLSGSVKV